MRLTNFLENERYNTIGMRIIFDLSVSSYQLRNLPLGFSAHQQLVKGYFWMVYAVSTLPTFFAAKIYLLLKKDQTKAFVKLRGHLAQTTLKIF